MCPGILVNCTLLWIKYPCIKTLLYFDSSGRLVGSLSWAVFVIVAVSYSGIVAFD